MVNELQARLRSLYAARVQLAQVQVGPQMAWLERYRIIASGQQLYTLLEAADRIAELEAAEEGAKEAFGVVVDSKRELEARLASLQANYDALRRLYSEAKA
jgi:hypothetical protein